MQAYKATAMRIEREHYRQPEQFREKNEPLMLKAAMITKSLVLAIIKRVNTTQK